LIRGKERGGGQFDIAANHFDKSKNIKRGRLNNHFESSDGGNIVLETKGERGRQGGPPRNTVRKHLLTINPLGG